MRLEETVSAAQLAYLGDAVLEKAVRRRIVMLGVRQPSEYALAYVTAVAQSDALERIFPYLTEEEAAVYRRGRNTVHGNVPKHATMAQYRRATGFETLFGYLDLQKADERVEELVRLAYPDLWRISDHSENPSGEGKAVEYGDQR